MSLEPKSRLARDNISIVDSRVIREPPRYSQWPRSAVRAAILKLAKMTEVPSRAVTII